jgi:3D (Asp-Asp-Asp) domain-containing protein
MQQGKYTYLGIYRTTGYNFVKGQCPNDLGITYSGRQGVLGLSCAIDPAVLGLKSLRNGDYLYVSGIGLVRIDDTGNLVKGKHLDIACGDVRIANVINGRRDVWFVGQI